MSLRSKQALPHHLKEILDLAAEAFNGPEFLEADPVQIPHRFSRREDIEIAGFFAALFAWGLRKTILRKAAELLALMDDAPYEFIRDHSPKDLTRFRHFRHRTFMPEDLRFFVQAFQQLYAQQGTLEKSFTVDSTAVDIEAGLIRFHQQLLSFHPPQRTRKHISSPATGSTCKRLAMFLRWMVRQDSSGVDFGIWRSIKPAQLVCPLDLHVDRVARGLGLIQGKGVSWRTVQELTARLRELDPEDPVKYDFALFGLGVTE